MCLNWGVCVETGLCILEAEEAEWDAYTLCDGWRGVLAVSGEHVWSGGQQSKVTHCYCGRFSHSLSQGQIPSQHV